ncbi:MAG TPA: nuclear transport factor 2 family protein [Bryobacteraceae bacterium]|nr:nuclear transport factor 2 family protein [Bryobacteraceae bacterium]
MTPEDNIKIAKKAYADFQSGNIPGILAALDDNIEWTTADIPEMAGTGAVKGKDKVLTFFKTVGETWDFQAFEPKEYIASGDQLVVLGSYRPRSRKTGNTVSAAWAMAWRFRNGKVTHFQEYTDSAALRSALTARASA